MVMYWWLKEARGGETDNPFDTNREAPAVANIELADGAKAAGTTPAPEADTTKTEQPAATGEQSATDAPTEKTEGTEKPTEPAEGTVTITKSDVASMIEDAITKAVQPYEERIKALGAELAEVKATPIPGGPARTRTPGQTAVTQKADGLRAAVEHLEKAVGASTGLLQQGYRERLAQAQAELLTLEGSTTS
jgi:tetrahydromethanopterin S-methyltransferase subunit B